MASVVSAFSKNLLLGMLRCDRICAHTFGIYSVWVAPEIRSQGVAKHLLALAETWIVDLGGKSSDLFLADKAMAARAFYLRCGYLENGNNNTSMALGTIEYGMTKNLT